MKKLIAILAVVLAMFVVWSPAFACDDFGCGCGGCDSAWIGGENFLDQWREGNGGYSIGNQGLNMWGAVHAPDAYGEYQASGFQAEGQEFTQEIQGGEIFTSHAAFQQGIIDITGGCANASVWGENNFSQNTNAGAEMNPDCGNFSSWSDSHGQLDMAGEVCLSGEGTASYTSEVLQQTGHQQEFEFANGTAFSNSLSQQRGFIEINQ